MHPVKSDYLFVYSSLLRGFPTPDYEYVSRYFNYVGDGKTNGILSIVETIVTGTPVDDERYIYGELYKIKDQQQFSFAIGQLDEYEGVNPEPPQEPIYRRELATIIKEDGTKVTAWVYWFNGAVDGYPVIESGNVLTHINGKG